jgi:Tfp pilus assembly protein PilF
VKSFAVFIICFGCCRSVLAQTPDPFQPDIPAPLVARVDAAKEKQAAGKDLDAAEAELKAVLQERPDYYRAFYNLGLIYQTQGKTDQALQMLEKAKKLRDSLHISDNSILNSIGWVYMNAGKSDEAESSFLEALKRERENTPANNERLLNNLAYLYLQKGDTAKARSYLQRSINEYHSVGAQKIIKMADEYDERKKALETKSSSLKAKEVEPR